MSYADTAEQTVSTFRPAILVPNRERMTFLPRQFGMRLMLMVESGVFQVADEMVEGGSDAYWDFFKLADGSAGFLAPHRSADRATVVLRNPLNYFEGAMSAQAAGIGLTRIALSRLWERTQSDLIAMRCNALTEWSRDHPEAGLIARLCD